MSETAWRIYLLWICTLYAFGFGCLLMGSGRGRVLVAIFVGVVVMVSLAPLAWLAAEPLGELSR